MNATKVFEHITEQYYKSTICLVKKGLKIKQIIVDLSYFSVLFSKDHFWMHFRLHFGAVLASKIGPKIVSKPLRARLRHTCPHLGAPRDFQGTILEPKRHQKETKELKKQPNTYRHGAFLPKWLQQAAKCELKSVPKRLPSNV